MHQPEASRQSPPAELSYDVGHTHSDVSGGWLRAATFGAMDGLVSSSALIASVAASANEQLDSAVHVERRALRTRPEAELAELVDMLTRIGMTEKAARAAADEIHRDEKGAISFHLVQELGVNPMEKPSARLAALWSFVMFAVGAVIPLIPYLLGYELLAAGLACAGVGLVIAGGLATRFTRKPIWWGVSRQLVFGALAIVATYLVGRLVATAL